MKFLSFLLCTILCLSLTVTSFAETALEENTLPPVEVEGDIDYTNDETLNLLLNGMQQDINSLEEKTEVLENEVSALNESITVPDSPDENVIEEETEVNPETEMPVSVELFSVAPITPEDTSGLKAVLLSVIGDYDPVIVEYEYQNSNNYSSYLREVLPDYPWFAGFLMLSLFVYCIFRLGGALIG